MTQFERMNVSSKIQKTFDNKDIGFFTKIIVDIIAALPFVRSLHVWSEIDLIALANFKDGELNYYRFIEDIDSYMGDYQINEEVRDRIYDWAKSNQRYASYSKTHWKLILTRKKWRIICREIDRMEIAALVECGAYSTAAAQRFSDSIKMMLKAMDFNDERLAILRIAKKSRLYRAEYVFPGNSLLLDCETE